MSHRRGVIAFLLITFLSSWPWWFIEHLGFGWSLVNPLAQLPTAFSPAVAAIVVRRWITREGFKDAGLALRLRATWRWYLAAWLGPIAITVATLAVAAALGLWQVDLAPLGSLPVALPIVTLILTPAYWGEEFGWTGYLRSHLYRDRPLTAAVVVGLLWAVWHYPLAFLGYIEFRHPLPGLVVWTGSFVLQQVALTWLYLRSGTVWVAALAHSGNNMVIGFVTGLLLIDHGRLDDVTTMLLTAVPLGGACIAIVRRGRRSRRPADVAWQATTCGSGCRAR
ncbi:CPBP family intramembrane metalloprotease [Planosporangium thailandense]|uniref:CPBP family intramembrane metalloprotease n=1 Tax=Planosporangium thailandense TaxID=765197 RepID=A0ABX0Y9R8_9ACTN|nr:CPBP family intramembrane glutamic endopeptidase [Planosporangium thailandense]NJC74150.1 CPBP family intramembrane metalloprotease [Planosporangium thailandense]